MATFSAKAMDTIALSRPVENILNSYAVYRVSPARDSPKEASPSVTIGDAIEAALWHKEIGKPPLRLSLLSSDMRADEESSLRSHLLDYVNKPGQVLKGSTLLSLDGGKLFEAAAQVYFNLIESTLISDCDVKKFLVCFMVQVSHGLELFHPDLDVYCDSLLPHLERYMESTDITEYLKRLESWYERVICFVERCLEYLSEDLAVVIFASFSNEGIAMRENVDDLARQDIERFYDACSLSSLLMDPVTKETAGGSSLSNPLLTQSSPVFRVKRCDDIYTIEPRKMTTFCKECVRAMRRMQVSNPFRMRELVENYKLKCIQDMNAFRRLLKQAEADYYSLYKSFIYLVVTGNGLVLLKNARMQSSYETLAASVDVLRVLDAFVVSKGGFDAVEKLDRTALWRERMNSDVKSD